MTAISAGAWSFGVSFATDDGDENPTGWTVSGIASDPGHGGGGGDDDGSGGGGCGAGAVALLTAPLLLLSLRRRRSLRSPWTGGRRRLTVV